MSICRSLRSGADTLDVATAGTLEGRVGIIVLRMFAVDGAGVLVCTGSATTTVGSVALVSELDSPRLLKSRLKLAVSLAPAKITETSLLYYVLSFAPVGA